jgi:PPE-repeat protein
VGQNAAAIAANQAQYAGMWVQDAAAMYSYAGQSAAASQVTPFNSPPQNTNPAGSANQAAALAQSAGASDGGNTETALSQLTSATPTALQSLATPAQGGGGPISALTDLLSSLNSSPLATLAGDVELLPKLILPANDILISIIMGLVIGGRALTDVATAAGSAGSGTGAALATGLGSSAPGVASAGAAGAVSAVSAGVGQAGFVGGLATPPTWAAATPAIKTAAAVLSGAGEGAVPAAAVSQGSLFSGAAGAGMAGAALGSAVPRAATTGRGTSATEFRDVKDLKNSSSSPNLQRIVAEMAEKPESVQHWHTDSEHLDGLLAQLQQKPGIHAVHVSKDGKPKMTPPKSQSV